MPSMDIPPRSEIPEAFTWNAPSVFESPSSWETALGSLSNASGEVLKYKGHLKEGSQILLAAFKAIETVVRLAYKLAVYAGMASAVDTTDQSAARMFGRIQSAIGQVTASVAFLDPELLSIGQDELSLWMSQDPELAIYAHYIENLYRKQAYVRSTEVEELLGLVSDPFGNVSQINTMLVNADFKFKPARTSGSNEVPVTSSTFDNLMTNPDRQLRSTAYDSYTGNFLNFKNTLGSLLATSVKSNIFLTRARRHSTTLEMALFTENIPVDVFHNLIKTYRKNLPTWHRYWAVRRKILGVDSLQPYDIWAPLTKNPPKLTFEECVDWICKGLAPLGKTYTDVIRRGCLEDRWVDFMPNLGKMDGAFSSGSKDTYPFILMSFDGTTQSLGTLAHELGHSMHSYLTWQKQPFVYSSYSLFLAEVASNFHQAMVRAYLLENVPDPDFQISVIEEAMSNFHRYFFIMPTLACFELEIHQREERGDGLTADDMIKLMADLFAEGYGEEMQYDRQKIGITWATFPHLYTDYYVYQYATGISGANTFARRILSGIPNAAQDYLGFLQSGGSGYPLDILRKAGVDLSTPQPVEETFVVLSGLVDRLEKLIV